MNRNSPKNHKTKAGRTSLVSAVRRLRVPKRQAVGYEITLSTPIEESVRPEQPLILPNHRLVVPVVPEKRGKKHESKKS
jgi:hypothetical protein